MTLPLRFLTRTTCLGLAALMLFGCSWHRNRVSSCRENNTVVAKAQNNPPLKVPPGLDAPDTRNAIKVPDLNEPERPRSKNEPCLSQPPSYKG